MLDAFTSSMCVDSWGWISFAHALIEIHANSELKKEVRMVIPVDDDDGTDYTSEVCEPEVVDNSDKNNDGFTDMVNRKNKGNKVANQMPKNQIEGIKFHNPKSSFYRPVNKQANDKQTKKKPAANDKASTSHASGEKSTPTSNAFDVLNSEEGAEFGGSNPIIETAYVEGDAQNLKSAAKEASKNNPRSSPVVEDSKEDEVYCSNAKYTSRVGSGFSMDEDDLDGYDGYEAQVYDIPERLQTYCDGFDIRLNSRGRK
ncbi:hypothetical protein Tco_1151237 [Tanacetum coccineum]